MPSTVASTQHVVSKPQPTALVLLTQQGCLESRRPGGKCACVGVASGTGAEPCVGGRMSV